MKTIDAVQKLNEKMWEKSPDDNIHSFYYQANDYVEAVLFNDHILWDSENDPRGWLEDMDGNELDEQEDLYVWCVMEMKKYVQEISKISLSL